MRRRDVLLGLVSGCAWLAGGGVSAATFPDRLLTLIVAGDPMGDAGSAARALQPGLEQALGHGVMVDFRPGAGGVTGLIDASYARPDGYTLVMLGPVIAAAPWLALRMDCTPADFAIIGRVAASPVVLVTQAHGRYRDVPGLVAAARDRPGSVATCFTGVWDSAALAQALFLERAGLRARLVPGVIDPVAAVAEGTLDFTVLRLALALRGISGGMLRPLAVSGAHRAAALPEVPSLAEAGFPGIPGSWLAVGAPAATPRRRRVALAGALHRALASPEAGAGFADAGLNLAWQDGARMQDRVVVEYQALNGALAAAGVNVRIEAARGR